MTADITAVTDWWKTSVTRIAPGEIDYRGMPVQNLIGEVGFVATIWLLVRGELPSRGQERLLEAALVASADHGPQAPSIASARMAATCGVGINSAIANGVNVLGDTHGGAGQQCTALLNRLAEEAAAGADLDHAATTLVQEFRERGAFVPGFGHRFHPVDPRRDPLLELVRQARTEGIVEGRHLDAGLALEAALQAGRKPIPMNIDGVTAIIYAELGVPPELARGLFVLSRSVGILAHAWEESQSGRRIKGPLPPPLLAPYDGPVRGEG